MTAGQTAAQASPPTMSPAQPRLLLAIAALLTVGVYAIGMTAGMRQAIVFGLGAWLGYILYRSKFGFAGAWRAFIVSRDAAGIRAQMLCVAVAMAAIVPLLALGTFAGQPMTGLYSPIGVSLVVGAALFGFGMQLGGGCGSGCLYGAGGGDTRIWLTLVFFVAGATWGTADFPWWDSLPAFQIVRLQDRFGVIGTVAVQLIGLAAIAAAASLIERKIERTKSTGAWPLALGAVLLGLSNAIVLVVAGHPWSVTFGFSLWGAKILAWFGVSVATWEFWTWSGPAAALAAPIAANSISTLDFGLVLGAALAAALAGRLNPHWKFPLRAIAASVVGGLAMGYGARLGFGCNIGALVGGIASGSLHGWVWLVCAFAGSVAGVRARPYFGLAR
jgi:uncharacterized membrane protein YedE/YeeE